MAPVRRVGIRDVARAAGVSTSTVSKVMNGRDGIAEETQARVRAIAQQLAYASNIGAQSLRARRTRVIGVLTRGFDPYATEVLKGLSHACEGSGYELLAWSAGRSGSEPGWETRLLGRLAGTLIDAAVLVTPSVLSVPLEGLPIVAIDPHSGRGMLPSFHGDDYGGACQAVDHLASLGHGRIGFLGGRVDLASAADRERGYRDTVARLGLDASEDLIGRGDYTPAGADAPARALLRAPSRPTAIFVANDMSALRVLEVAHELGLDVPRQLSLVGFDNIPESTLCTPALTTIAQPLHEIGERAMRMLLAMLDGEPPGVGDTRVPTRLVVRDSTAPPALDAPPGHRAFESVPQVASALTP